MTASIVRLCDYDRRARPVNVPVSDHDAEVVILPVIRIDRDPMGRTPLPLAVDSCLPIWHA